MGVQEVNQVGEQSEWAKPSDMATTMWEALRIDCLKPPFSSGKHVATFTAISYDMDSRTAELLVLGEKVGGGGGGGMECRSMNGSKPFRIPGDNCNVHERHERDESDAALAAFRVKYG